MNNEGVQQNQPKKIIKILSNVSKNTPKLIGGGGSPFF